jgi:Dolichyl-phosphate-mannose-protein mannosyltransferase
MKKIHPAIIFFALFAIAALFRAPHLLVAPGFYESNELEVTFSLLSGNSFPLHGQHAHIGALANYIVAAAFKLLGMHYWVPRVLILILGSLTIPLTFRLGRRLLDPASALLGALLMAGSMYHIFSLSHVPWSNSMTPFFCTAALLALAAALYENSGAWLILAGFLLGLSLQTHPAILTLYAACLVIFLFQGKERLRQWLRRPALYIAFLAIVLGYGNMVWYNIENQMHSLHEAVTYPSYAIEDHIGVQSFVSNSGDAWTLLLRLLSGSAEDRPFNSSYWLNPAYVLCALALFAGIFLCLKRKKWELPLLVGLPMVTIPIINAAYEFCKFGRYLGFLLPLVCLLAAYAAIEFLRFLRNRLPQAAVLCTAAWLILPLGYFAYHLTELSRTYVELERDNPDLFSFREVRSILAGEVRSSALVLVDPRAEDSIQLLCFLKSDGWNTDMLIHMHGRLRKIDGEDERLQQDLSDELTLHQRAWPTGDVVAIISGASLNSFLTAAPNTPCNHCLVLGPVDGGLYNMLKKTVYYFFTFGTDHQRDPSSASALRFVQKVAPAFQDGRLVDPEEWSQIAAQLGEETQSINRVMRQSCNLVKLDLPKKECLICNDTIVPGNTPRTHAQNQARLRKLNQRSRFPRQSE